MSKRNLSDMRQRGIMQMTQELKIPCGKYRSLPFRNRNGRFDRKELLFRVSMVPGRTVTADWTDAGGV